MGRGRNRIGGVPGTLHLAASFGCSGFQTGPLFAETGTSYSAARIGQIRSGANKSPANLVPKRHHPTGVLMQARSREARLGRAGAASAAKATQ
jgi:hypothetical protein